MQWDERVDVLCTGSGLGGLATAIAAVDADVDVYVADSAGIEVEDAETSRYFRELSRDLRVPVHRAATAQATTVLPTAVSVPVIAMTVIVIRGILQQPSTHARGLLRSYSRAAASTRYSQADEGARRDPAQTDEGPDSPD